MSTVGSAVRVDGVDLQVMVNAAAFARPQANPAATPADSEPDAQISPVGKLRSAASATLDAAAQLRKPQTWSATTASSDKPQVVQAVSNKAASGDYSVSVDALAAAQTTASATFSSLSTVIGIGTLNIELGGWNTSQTAFATNPNWPKASVTFGPKDTSLERIRDKINAAGVGVIASVVSDATGSRLVLRSTSTGAANGFKVSAEPSDKATPDAAQALAALGFDPSAINGGNATMVQAAQDAKLKIDGREVQSAQNLVEDKATGLSLRLHDVSQGEVNVHVKSDTASLSQDVHDFANAYNDMSAQLASIDPQASDSGIQAARNIQLRVQDAFKPDGNPSALPNRFGDIGVTMNRQGVLKVDDARLTASLEQNPAQVQSLFTHEADAGGSPTGLAIRLQDLTLHEATGKASDDIMATTAPANPDSSTSMAGSVFRQKLLEQYAAPTDMGTGEHASAKHDDEAVMPVNAG
jgi:flagellar hook-associated protein 2